MKRIAFVLSVISVLFLSSCRDIVNTVLDAMPPFTESYSTTQDIPFAAVSTTSYTRTPELPMSIDLDAKIKERNAKYGINNLKSVKMTSLTTTYIASQLGVKLDAIKNMQIYIKAPNLPEKMIASVYNNKAADKIVFTTTDAELLDYFKTKENSMIVEIQGNFPSADRITIQMDAGFEIKVQL